MPAEPSWPGTPTGTTGTIGARASTTIPATIRTGTPTITRTRARTTTGIPARMPSTTPTFTAAGRSRGEAMDPRLREAIESGWHVAVIGLAFPPVARTVARSRSARRLTALLLAGGAVWHIAVAVMATEASRRRRFYVCR